jgi:26S proteasome regulatory subunit N2
MQTVQLLAPYLPGEGRTVSPYSEGGALYALGIIHAGHGQAITEFLSTSLHNSTHEVVQHGACLAIGLAAQGIDDEATYENLRGMVLVKTFEDVWCSSAEFLTTLVG